MPDQEDAGNQGTEEAGAGQGKGRSTEVESAPAQPESTSPPGSRPWDRRASETPRQFELFRRFVSMGPSRSLKRVAEEFDLAIGYVHKISALHDWTSRAMGYEADFDRRVASWLERSRTRRELLDAGNREAGAALIRHQVKKMLRKSVEDKDYIIKPEVLESLLSSLAKFTALESGRATERVDVGRQDDPTALFDQLRKRMEAERSQAGS